MVMKYKMNYRFYLEKRFKKGTNTVEVKRLEKQGKPIGKYLNPNETAINIGITYNERYLKVGTGIRVLAKHFNVDKQRVLSSHPDCVEINNKLERIKSNIKDRHYSLVLKGKTPSIVTIKSIMEEEAKGIAARLDTTDFFKIFDKYMEEKSKMIKHQTFKNYQTFRTCMVDFVKAGYKLNIDAIDEVFWNQFYTFCAEEKNYLNNTTAKQVRCLKTFCNWMYEKNYIDHQEYKKIPDREEDGEIIYLTWDEIEAIKNYDFDFKPRLGVVRDQFIFQIHTGQRIGDILKCKISDIMFDADTEQHYWKNYQEKGSRTKATYIPLSETAMQIVNKYAEDRPTDSYLFPSKSRQAINGDIKEICRYAGLDSEITITRYSGKKKISITKEKWEMITSHIARKTFISQGLRNGIPKDIIMKITGHKDERSVRHYLNLDKEFISKEALRVWK